MRSLGLRFKGLLPRSSWSRLQRVGLELYGSLFALTVLLLAFLKLAGEIGETETLELDRQILLALRTSPRDPIGPHWFERLWLDWTTLGGAPIVGLWSAVLVGFFLILRQWRNALWVALLVNGCWLSSLLLKNSFGRPRPEAIFRVVEVSSLSFPSGHSLAAAAVYPTLGILVARLVPGIRLKLYVGAVALLFMILVGLSRIYLGVHYPSDVLAGWAAGLGWAIFCYVATQALQRRGALEPAATAAVAPPEE